MATTQAPPGLGKRGAEYWHSVTGTYDLTDSELALLLEACRTADNLDQLAATIAEHGPMVVGSNGQPVVNPALTEARGQRIVLHRLIAALALPDPKGAMVPTTATTKARTAAAARWAGHVKEQGA